MADFLCDPHATFVYTFPLSTLNTLFFDVSRTFILISRGKHLSKLMGVVDNPLGPNLADVFLGMTEQNIHDNISKFSLYKRYPTFPLVKNISPF